MPVFSETDTVQQKVQVRQKARKELDDKKYRIWCDTVLSLDVKSDHFQRPYKEDNYLSSIHALVANVPRRSDWLRQ